MVYGLIYASISNESLTVGEKNRILAKAQDKNRSLGVTGFLSSTGQSAYQYIEGPENIVKQLFETIQQDSRHSVVTHMEITEIEDRLFPDWSMADIEKGELESSGLALMLQGFMMNSRDRSDYPGQAQIVATQFIPVQ